MSGARSTFSFGRDFTQQAAGGSSPFLDPNAKRVPIAHADHLRLVEEAKAAAFQMGVEEGKRQQADHEAQRLASCFDALVSRIEIATIEMRRLESNARKEALDFAKLFASKLAGKMIETAPMQPIEATARAIFNDVRGTPHLAIRVAPSLVDTCKTRISLLMRENGIEAKLFVFPDPDIPAGDCRIEWADGGIVRDRAKLETLVDRAASMLFPAEA